MPSISQIIFRNHWFLELINKQQFSKIAQSVLLAEHFSRSTMWLAEEMFWPTTVASTSAKSLGGYSWCCWSSFLLSRPSGWLRKLLIQLHRRAADLYHRWSSESLGQLSGCPMIWLDLTEKLRIVGCPCQPSSWLMESIGNKQCWPRIFFGQSCYCAETCCLAYAVNWASQTLSQPSSWQDRKSLCTIQPCTVLPKH